MRYRVLVPLALLTLALAACGGEVQEGNSSSPAPSAAVSADPLVQGGARPIGVVDRR